MYMYGHTMPGIAVPSYLATVLVEKEMQSK